MYKIIIADDHPIVRNGLKQIIAEEADLIVAAEVPNAEKLFEVLQENNFDLLILDIAMPGQSGIDALIKLKSLKPNLPTLILSALSEELYALRTIKSGAAGYLHKESAPENLIVAIRKILNGGFYISPFLAESMAHQISSDKEDGEHSVLSNREFQILRMIGSGKTVGDIAVELNLSVTTISTFRKRILDKMNFKNNAEITYYCIKKGLVD
jgi:DNA-binding NarL/FixJ family response regulator